MDTIDYRLEPRHVAAYQYAVRRRISRQPGPRNRLRGVAIFAGLFIAGAFGTALTETAFHALTGRLPEFPELFIGFALGVFIALALQWGTYLAQRGRLARADGPTYAPHKMRFDAEALTVETAGISNRIAWSAFEAVTEEKDIVVLWLEPGLGISLPDTGFADAAGKRTFAEAASRRITEAKAGQ